MTNFYAKLAVWTLVCLALFGLLWKKGALKRLADYIAETSDEMKKCNWPTWEELQQSTILVFIVIALLGVFTMGVDFFIGRVVRFLMGV